MKCLKTNRFNIGEIVIGFEADWKIKVGEEFIHFCVEDNPNYRVVFRQVEELECCRKEPVQKLMGIDIFLDGYGGFVRQFKEEGKGARPYAIQHCDWEHKIITVEYINEGQKNLNHTNGAFFHSAWEDIILREQRMIVHACCVETPLGGILFSGRSGIGKSTQGELWCRYEGAKVINGDRPILRKDEVSGEWMAYGSPYAGSSRYHINANVSVRAIAILEQAKECTIRRLSVAEAFQKLYAQLTVSTWDSVCVEMACNLLESLVTEIPVYEFACTPDYEAVKTLKNTIGQEVAE